MTEIRESFLDYWCDEIPDYLRVKWRENVDGLLDTPNANEKLQAAWEAWQAARATPADHSVPVAEMPIPACTYKAPDGVTDWPAYSFEQMQEYRAAGSRPVVWQEMDEEGSPLFGENTFTEAPGYFEHERALCVYAQAPQPEAQSVRDGWQPIETAPRDGRNILIRFGRDGVSQAMYVPGVPHPWKFIDTNDGVTWLINSARDGEYGPSHWMPMPAPPQKPVSDEVKP